MPHVDMTTRGCLMRAGQLGAAGFVPQCIVAAAMATFADAIGSNEGLKTSDQIALRRLLALLKQLTINVPRPM